MIFLTHIISISLFFILIWLIGESGVKSDTNSNTSTIEQKNSNGYALIFRAEKVLWSFEIDDVVFPIWQEKPGVFLDDYGNSYKPYDNVTDILNDLKRKGFQLFALLNICLNPDCLKRFGRVHTKTPEKENIDKIFKIFGWEKLFDGIHCFYITLNETIEKINNDTGIPFSKMMYFDSNEMYDFVIVERYQIFRWMFANGITYEKIKDALINYSSTPGNQNVELDSNTNR